MKVLTSLGLSIAFALLLGTGGSRAAGCDPLGNVKFICDQASPEDLVLVPGGEWVVASAYAANNGGIRLVNVRDQTTTVLFPTAKPQQRPDTKAYPSCPGPINLPEKDLRIHGLYLRPGRNSVHTLYTVHHGGREAIEVFELDARAKPPTLTWIGCSIAPEPIGLNAVVALPDGGFAATNFRPRNTDAAAQAKTMAGENNGELWEVHASTGWTKVPGSEASAANGIEISKDGKWYYVAEFGSQKFLRVSHGQTPVKRDEIPLGFRIDNLRWSPDGSLYGAGQAGTAPGPQASVVIKIDPDNLKVQELVRYPYNDTFGSGTVALHIGKELWVGTFRGDRIARFAAP